jgi:hypothetical protein
MARGWESKSVEDQIEAAESRRASRAQTTASDIESERERRRRGLLLERTRLLREMERGHKRRYLELLERGLAHVEAELARFDQERPRNESQE